MRSLRRFVLPLQERYHNRRRYVLGYLRDRKTSSSLSGVAGSSVGPQFWDTIPTSPKVIGLLSFVSNGQRQGEIGWALGVEHRGSGYATEAVRGLITYAFDSCAYHRVFAGTILTNEPSWKLMARVGMRKEAHFREAHVPTEPGGPWIDSVRYAVLASEWPIHPKR
jgi:RimJ/RimL family protein N-acetyltransferase